MKSFDFLHSGSIQQDSNANWSTLRTKLKDFKNDWTTMDVVGLRSAADEIVFLMYRDNNNNFKQYNSAVLIDAFKCIVDNLNATDHQWKFYDEFKEHMKLQNIPDKNVRFLDSTLTFVRQGRKIGNYLTINLAETVVPE